MNNEFLREVYLKLMERPAVEPIQEAAMYRAARARLLDKLVALVMEQIGFLQRAKEFAINVQGKSVSPEPLSSKKARTPSTTKSSAT